MNSPSSSRPVPDTRRYAREVRLTWSCLVVTFLAWAEVTWKTSTLLWQYAKHGDLGGAEAEAAFIVITQLLVYGAFVYQWTRIGYLQRRLAHERASAAILERFHDGKAPSLAILVPAYREEIAVVRRTLLSAALQDYPSRRVMLLIDDPPEPPDPAARAALAAMRELPQVLQRMFDAGAVPLQRAAAEFEVRWNSSDVVASHEAGQVAALYGQAAVTVAAFAKRWPAEDHADRLFCREVVKRLAAAYRARGQEIEALAADGRLGTMRIRHEYRRLANLFTVQFGSFERKRYSNLSHAANKAMNLNAYLGLIGASWREFASSDGLLLLKSGAGDADLAVPDVDFVLTLDADSVVLPEYAAVMVNEMTAEWNNDIAVAQTPYNAFPGAPGLLERIAGATTDIQYLIHQGFCRFNATYWVGANALLRMAALRDIAVTQSERGYEVPIFIRDRTVIEDTESTIDLVTRGWRLHNHPDRLAFSATPPDFGALIIQRARWANGGLLILPKLLRWLLTTPLEASAAVSSFFRLHYLISIAAVNLGLVVLLGHDFEACITGPWLPLSAVPYFFLYARDLQYNGYRAADLFHVYALNLLLVPVNLAGVWKSLQQAATGRRIPFARTPKVSGRTAISGPFLLAEYALFAAMLAASAWAAHLGHWASAGFGAANALVLGLGISRFIGWRESFADLARAFAPSRAPAVSVPAAAGAGRPTPAAIPEPALARTPPPQRLRVAEATEACD